MLIDFHTHCFPDGLAGRTMESLSKIAGVAPNTDGTARGLLSRMDAEGADRAVVLHIATRPKNQRSVNNFAAQLQADEPRLWCFGSVHPFAPDAREELFRIKELGLHGVKLHPDYQDFFLRDERAYPVYETIAQLGLPVAFHTGEDPYSPGVVHAPPEDVAALAKALPGLRIIAAHMGGMKRAREALLSLCGLKNVYLDTAMSAPSCDPALFRQLLLAHGTERVLFGSDCPWSTPAAELAFLKAAGLSPEALADVTANNALRLLGKEQGET